ncbi:MAG: N-acetylglucosamine kinase [Candidatus Kryptoniota bacterium]
MSQSLFLGFDGGATKTEGVALNSERKIVAEGVGKPANFQIIGVEQASINIIEIIELILKKVNADLACIKSMCIGLAGAGRKADAEKMRRGILDLLEKKKYPIPRVQVESDAIAALEGAFGGKPGMILIGGTGSVMFAKESGGEVHRVGGWGRYIGDEGSGYALGRSCLAAVAKDFDGRGNKTIMTSLLKQKKGIDNPQSLIEEVYQNSFDISSAAQIVIEAAERGDGVALGIVAVNADELVQHVCAMLDKLKPVTDLPAAQMTTLPLVLIGSVLSRENILSQSFRRKMTERFPDIRFQSPQFSPAVGAAHLAIQISCTVDKI